MLCCASRWYRLYIHVFYIYTDAVVRFQYDTYVTKEDSGSVEICVISSRVLAADIVVRYVHSVVHDFTIRHRLFVQ